MYVYNYSIHVFKKAVVNLLLTNHLGEFLEDQRSTNPSSQR